MTKKLKFYDSVFSQEKELETKILVSFDEEEISRDSFSKFLSWFEKDEQQMVIGLYESLPKEDKEDFLKLLDNLDSEALENIKNEMLSVLRNRAESVQSAVLDKIKNKEAEIDKAVKEEKSKVIKDYSYSPTIGIWTVETGKPEETAGSEYMTLIPSSQQEEEALTPSSEDAKDRDQVALERPSIITSSLQCSDLEKQIVLVGGVLGEPKSAEHYGVGAQEENILLVPNDNFVQGDEFLYTKWKKYLDCFIKNKEFEYLNFSFVKPVKKRLAEIENESGFVDTVEITPCYNFYVEEYEKSLGVIKNKIIPNMYVFSFFEREMLEKREPNFVYKNLITLGKTYNYNVLSPQGQYFSKFPVKYKLLARTRKGSLFFSDLEKRLSNIIVPYEEVEYFNNVEINKNLFPLYTQINFATDRFASFSEILKESGLFNVFMAEMVDKFITGKYDEKVIFNEKTIDISNGFKKRTSKEQLKIIDLDQWFKKLAFLAEEGEEVEIVDIFNNVNYNKATPLGISPLDSFSKDDPRFNLHKQLSFLIFVSKIKKLINKYKRNFMDIYRGKPVHSEVVFYRITKYFGKEKTSSKIIQSYFIPNTAKVDILKFIDTQVKYDEQYFYDIVSYQVVFGFKVRYTWVADAGEKGALHVVTVPTLKIIEVPFYNESVKILDKPPLPPQVQFVPYRDVHDKVLINLSGDVGSKREKPIPIESADIKMFEEIKKNQDLGLDEIDFRSDDHAISFEIFRTLKKPFSYKDFEGSLWKIVGTDVDYLSEMKATSASVKDEVKVNQKYYYMFRTVDVHGNKSNPSCVYEIEIVKDENFAFLSFKIVNFAENLAYRERNKKMKKRLKILPNLGQVLINEEKSGFLEKDSVDGVHNVVLGVKDESLWGELFKIRITSKHSGKKLDLNIKFVCQFDNRTQKF